VTADPQYEPLSIWTVYDHPRDYPEHVVARRWRITAGNAFPTADVRLFADLSAAQEYLGAPGLGLTRLTRDVRDDPAIAEVWL